MPMSTHADQLLVPSLIWYPSPLLAPGYRQDPERLTPQEREATWEQARFMAGWNRKLNTNKVGVVPGYM
jgi:hypothetical protein